MGQGSSQPQRGPQQQRHVASGDEYSRRRRQSMLAGLTRQFGDEWEISREESGGVFEQQRQRRPPMRSNSTNRLSRLLHPSSDTPLSSDAGPSRRSVLQRSRTTLSNIFRREEMQASHGRPSRHSILQQRSSYVRAAATDSEEGDYYPPRLPSIEQTSTFDHDLFASSQEQDSPPRSSSSHRLQNIRFNSLRPDRPFRHITSSFRRRRSPPPASLARSGGPEDQAAMLSRLLSVAAAATAATLMGDDQHALREARSLAGGTGFGDIDMTGSGEDGSFDGFLRALQNGRIASALRQGENGQEGGEPGQAGPLNFFRMFRFGASGSNENTEGDGRMATQPQDPNNAGNGTDGRLIPIIIVGIRSISPNSNSSSNSVDDLPPFIDALGANFPPPHAAHGHDSIDSILRPPQNGTSFRHRRRASMGGFGMGRSRIDDRYDAQRDHRSPDRRRDRPWSMASSNSHLEPRPPPATPASPSPELSRISSRNTTPSHSRPASMIANSIRDFAPDSRRNSVLHRSAASPLSSHTEETVSLHSTRSSDNLLSHTREHESFRGHRRSDTAPNIHYPRFASGHPRRNGVVEPDNLPSLSRSSTSNATETTTSGADPVSGPSRDGRNSTDSRSWIIYVLGGSYPENHPILSTPSLFTENPTYEDMMLLSALLGPAKAPVATEEDVQSAGGIYDIVVVEQPDSAQPSTAPGLIAIATADTNKEENPERVALELDQRCLVCLCDFEAEEVARRLGKCGHLFHKECIDQWLTQGRNSCPLCRGQGVNEKDKLSAENEAASESAAAEVAAAA